jgi:MYXO-CTERM domain-containing protein
VHTMKKGIALSAAICALTAGTVTQAAQTGPDAAAHVMSDNITPALFSFVNITATGTQVTTGDDAVGDVTFPNASTFWFYGSERTAVRVSTNGFISFTANDNAGADYTNDCPVPFAPSDGAGDRVYVLHDDLISTAYYQYFPLNAPPPGWIGDTSVIQWSGTYFSGGQAANFEILIFHSLDVAVMLYQTVGQGGSGSTTGIQNAASNVGLSFACNTANSVLANKMIALGTLHLNEIRADQPNADNDEYVEISGVPGFNLTGITLVAIGDGLMAQGSGVIEAVVPLNASFNPAGNVFFTAAENTFTLTPPADLVTNLNFENDDTVTYALVTAFSGANGQDLDTNDDGFLDILPWTLAVDAVSALNEAPPPVNSEWGYAINSVGPGLQGAPFHIERCGDVHGSWVQSADDPASMRDTPSGLNLCPSCGDSFVEGTETCDDGGESATCDDDCTAASCGDGTQNATAGEGCDDGNATNTDACPDGVNGTCQPASCGDGFGFMGTEDCDGDGMGMPGPTMTCDADCTVASCGDMTVNAVAGETCDDGMRTATCDADCTAVSCGDGFVNMAAGETCDGDGMGTPGETATCDGDCTAAMCGDGVANAAAMEDCDTGGDSATCDDDCTDPACGDNHENAAAGEECDDGNTTPGDGCDATCQDEGAGGAGGGGAGPGGGGPGGGGSGPGGGGPGGGGVGGGMGGAGVGGSGTGNDDGEGGKAPKEESGCGCTVPGDTSASPAALLLALGLAGFAVRRRRR